MEPIKMGTLEPQTAIESLDDTITMLGLSVDQASEILGVSKLDLAKVIAMDKSNRSPATSIYSRYLKLHCSLRAHKLLVQGAGVPETIEELDGKSLFHYAFVDSLTNLQNRRGFQESFLATFGDAGLMQRSPFPDETVGIVFIDLDGLKFMNDKYGHAAGDRYIESFARGLSLSIRNGDIAARWGGDEFVVALRGFLARNEKNWISKLKSNLEQTGFFDQFGANSKEIEEDGGGSFSYGLSVFQTKFIGDGRTEQLRVLSDWIHQADNIMYANKFKNKSDSLDPK